jgi:poly(hydroxyalkanoate) depolymerase family esterase
MRKTLLSRSFQRSLNAMAKAGARAFTQALQPPSGPAQRPRRARAPLPSAQWSTGLAVGLGGARSYRLYRPANLRRGERLPLLVMLHGCNQDGQALADSSQMNRIAALERFFVLYPEQDRLSNAQRCWNWYDTRSGRAQVEAGIIEAAIQQVCQLQPVDTSRIALAGLSAGAGMAALLATRQPQCYRALAMHSGVAPGVAQSTASALSAMGGRRSAALPLAPLARGAHLPALLVIQGSADPVVAPANALQAAQLWAHREQAAAGVERTVQRGARYRASVTDYMVQGRLVATLCLVQGLGHAWSGGAAGLPFSDPKGPGASRMIWSFAARQFGRAAK